MRAFRNLWQTAGDYAVVWQKFSAEPVSASPALRVAPGDTVTPGDASSAALHGFHEREVHEGRSFQWSGPVASVVFEIARQEFAISLETGGLRHVPRGELRLYWNANRLKQLPVGAGLGRLAFRVRRRDFVAAGAQILTLIIAPLPGCAGGETRRLGLPLFAITFQPIPEPSKHATGSSVSA
jgi:hypothetical protein